MKTMITIMLLAVGVIASMAADKAATDVPAKDVYGFTVKDWQDKEVALEKYRGKVLLIVNTATKCGFTPQYKQLEELYRKYKDKGFEVLDFPCNQFGKQAPGTAEEIHTFCTGNFDVTFPQFAKIEVNGENAAPLYQFLTGGTTFKGFDKDNKLTPVLDNMLSKKNPDYAKRADIKWNFTKFLIGKDGKIVQRFEPTAKMESVDAAVGELLKQNESKTATP
ncbi:MAG: glutathione peroxidase [Kiritimatiellae bacterium]|nr:glutathione peroxidase [Kiritimatiellia bacterium]